MDPTRRRLLGTAAAAVVLAGCVTDDGDGDAGGVGATDEPTATDDSTATDEPTPTDAESTDTDDGEAPTVQVRAHPDLGDVLVGPEEMTLYMFDQDTEGEGASSCYEGCADSWPPLTVEGTPEAGDGVAADLTTFERDDGSTQVAAAGWPLYYFAGDEEPGDANGQGLNDVWWVLDPEGTPVRDGATPTATATETETETETNGGSSGGY